MIIWLASYPKSGNTWIRIFLNTLLFSEGKGDVDINSNSIDQFPLRKNFKDLTTLRINLKIILKFQIWPLLTAPMRLIPHPPALLERRKQNAFGLFMLFAIPLFASRILVPMDDSQANHLKAYGVTFWVLGNGVEADWLLNYRGGSFMFDFMDDIEKECIYRGISYETISSEEVNSILTLIASPQNNYDVIKLSFNLKP